MPNILKKHTLEGKNIASSTNGVGKLESTKRRMQLCPYFTLNKNQLQMDILGTSRTQDKILKTNEQDFKRLKSFCAVNEIITTVKGQPTK